MSTIRINPITLYSPSFGLNPKKAVIVEYNIPSECGNVILSIGIFVLPL